MPAVEQFEVILEFSCNSVFFYRIADLDFVTNELHSDLRKGLEDCYIYFICRRPRASIKPNSIVLSSDGVTFSLQYNVLGTSMTTEVLLPRSKLADEEAVFESSSYPHRELLSFDKEGRLLGSTLIGNLIHLFQNVPSEAKDLEAVYIGKGLKNSAQDRLASHSTLQRILADIHSNDPDYEVFILAYAFDQPKKNLTGRIVDKHFSEQERAQRRKLLEGICAYSAGVDDAVALIEASLIAYFQTSRYNTHYLSFPSNPVEALGPVVAAGFAAVGVTLDNSGIGALRLFSERIKPLSVHYVLVPLVQSGTLVKEIAAAQMQRVTNPNV